MKTVRKQDFPEKWLKCAWKCLRTFYFSTETLFDIPQFNKLIKGFFKGRTQERKNTSSIISEHALIRKDMMEITDFN